MEKQELSYSDCSLFIKYISEAKASLFALHFTKCRNSIESAKDLLYDWYFDDKINFDYYDWFNHLFNEAIEDYNADDTATLDESLNFILHELKKLMQRFDIKQDS